MPTTAPTLDVFPATSNPFATRWIRPGALPYLFDPPESLDAVVRRLNDNCNWGQIVGPHGSGKSTLVASLVQRLESLDRPVAIMRLTSASRRLSLPRSFSAGLPAVSLPPAIVVVDGYEQSNRFARWRLKSYCRRRAAGLIVTSHEDVGLPPLFQTGVTASSFRRVVSRLTAGLEHSRLPEVSRLVHRRHGENMREALFDLYDWFERNRVPDGRLGSAEHSSS